MQFPLSNIGCGKVYNCTVFFNLKPSDVKLDFNNGFRHELHIGDFERYAESTDLSRYFEREGVNSGIINRRFISYSSGDEGGTYTILDEMGEEKEISESEFEKSIEIASGPFKDGYAIIFGEIHYEGINASSIKVKEKVRFRSTIYLGEQGMGAPAPPSFVYDISLDSNNDNYKKEISLSQAINPTGFDRFNVKISAPTSSRHQFNLTLFYNNNKQFSIPNISLNYFMTRRDASYITSEKSPENESESMTGKTF